MNLVDSVKGEDDDSHEVNSLASSHGEEDNSSRKIIPLEFIDCHQEYPSISPRDTVDFVSDRSSQKKIKK